MSILLQPSRLENLAPQTLRLRALLEFGRLGWSADIEQSVESVLSRLPDRLQPEYRAALAREWLAAHLPTAPSIIPAFMAEASPFTAPETPLSMCAGRRIAVAMFPLVGLSNEVPPQPALIWLMAKSGPHQNRLPSPLPDYQGAFEVYLAAPDASIHGHSWQLAASLAEKAFANDKLVRELARGWIATGEVKPGGGLSVEIDNKLDLSISGRRWIVPSGAIPANTLPPPGTVFAATVAEAASSMSNQYVETPSESWPGACDEYHSFVSDQFLPSFAACLWSNSPEVTLWHTQDAKRSLPQLAKYLRLLETFASDKRIHTVSVVDRNLSVVEKELENTLAPRLQQGRVIVFNITNGTRLMGMAAHAIARGRENLRLIYSDLVADQSRFIQVRYHGGTYLTSALIHPPTIVPGMSFCLAHAASNNPVEAIIERLRTEPADQERKELTC